jgi:hypothetical protein
MTIEIGLTGTGLVTAIVLATDLVATVTTVIAAQTPGIYALYARNYIVAPGSIY